MTWSINTICLNPSFSVWQVWNFRALVLTAGFSHFASIQEIVQVSGVESMNASCKLYTGKEISVWKRQDCWTEVAAPDQLRGLVVALWHSSDAINEWHVCPHHYALSTRLVQRRTKHFHSLVSQFCTKQNNKNAKIRLVFKIFLYIRFLISRWKQKPSHFPFYEPTKTKK